MSDTPVPSSTQPVVTGPAASLVGTWRLLSQERVAADGTISHRSGPDTAGYLVYTPDGHMFAQIMQPNRRPFASGDPYRPTAAEALEAASGFMSYSGTFEVRAEGLAVHHVELSLAPNWIGTEQLRHFRIEGNLLKITSGPSADASHPYTSHLTWQRV